MKILFVGMPFSIHVVRWISLLKEQNWEVHFFSSFENAKPHPQLSDIIYHDHFYNLSHLNNNKIIHKSFRNNNIRILKRLTPFVNIIGKVYRHTPLHHSYQKNLELLITKIQPDIIHSMESQHGGYMVSKYFESHTLSGIKWVHSTFGIDLDFYGRFPEHEPKLKQMFKNISVYISEGERDLQLSKKMGYHGKIKIFSSAGGGYDIESYNLTEVQKPSTRKIILVKGYHDSVRRGQVALSALNRCKDILQGYEIFVYSCNKETRDYVTYLNYNSNIIFKILEDIDHNRWLSILKDARLSIIVNLSDGIPSVLFESMCVGTFPIQSINSSADEWINDGINGYLVFPDDLQQIENAIRNALIDDNMVDNAKETNYKLIKERLSISNIKKEIIDLYINI